MRGEFVSGSHVSQLFKVAEDPWETLDLSAFLENEEVIATMRKEMREISIQRGDVADGERAKVNFCEYFSGNGD